MFGALVPTSDACSCLFIEPLSLTGNHRTVTQWYENTASNPESVAIFRFRSLSFAPVATKKCHSKH